ncbi:MAG: hypothetical protein L6R38_003178 [Xanthoria sp. 2 TBL-2021]|nr:MAG: hypothetical protein L6R38_003178 [Xanthoria sp. 2 TBL-2021]
MPPEPEPFKPLRRIFAMKPPENKENPILEFAKKREVKFWTDMAEKAKEQLPSPWWPTDKAAMVEWFLNQLGIDPDQREVLIHAEYLKLCAESVVEWEGTMKWSDEQSFRSSVREQMDKLGIE